MDSAHLENISCCLIQHSRSQEIWRSPSVLLFSRIHHLPPPHNGLSNLRGSVCEGGADIPVCHSHCPSAAIQPEEMLAPPLWSQYSSSRLSHISSTSWKVRRVATGDRISQAKGDPIDSVVLFQWGRQLRVVACQYTGFRGSGLKYMSRQECLLHLFKPTLPANKV